MFDIFLIQAAYSIAEADKLPAPSDRSADAGAAVAPTHREPPVGTPEVVRSRRLFGRRRP